jgi:Arc/MetJ family transcription regulator
MAARGKSSGATRGRSSASAEGGRTSGKLSGDAQKRRTRAGRVRMQLLVDPELLARVGAAYGTTNKSDAVNAALRSAADNAAILRGIDQALGAVPDFPYLES